MSQPNQPNGVVQKLLGSCRELYKSNRQKGRQDQIYFTGEDEQLIIRRSELKQFAEKMANKSWSYQQRIKQLQGQIEQLAGSSQKICNQLSQQNRNLLQEQYRLMDLLNTKQQMLASKQKQIEQFVRKKQLIQLNIEQFQNIQNSDESKKKRNQFAREKIQLKDTAADSKYTGLKRKIMVGVRKVDLKEKNSREMAQQTDNQSSSLNDLELARLKLQISRLLSQLHQLNIKNQLLQIQNQHLWRQNELNSARQRLLQAHLYQTYLPVDQAQFSYPSHDINISQNSARIDDQNQKVDKMAAKLSVDNIKTLPQTIAPPITPHFSCSTFGLFSKKNATECLAFACLSDQIFESVSENQSSIRSESFY